LGFGVGYQFSRMFRGDISFDWRSDVTSRVPNSTLRYAAPNAAPLAPLADPGPIAMRDTVTDNFTSTNMTGMLNGYIDLPVTSRLTPYIGAGVGFVRHHARGELNRTTTCVSAVDCDPTVAIDPGATTLNSATRIGIGGADYALATAVMAGLSYQVWDNTKLDVGYRWLHLQGTVFSGALGTSAENLKIPDQNIHEMRVGLRYDIN